MSVQLTPVQRRMRRRFLDLNMDNGWKRPERFSGPFLLIPFKCQIFDNISRTRAPRFDNEIRLSDYSGRTIVRTRSKPKARGREWNTALRC